MGKSHTVLRVAVAERLERVEILPDDADRVRDVA